MSNREQRNNPDWSKLAPLLMGLVVLVVLAIFAVTMLLKLPETAQQKIILPAVFIGLAVSAFIVGYAWDQPTYLPRNRSSMRGAFFAIIAYWIFVSAVRFQSAPLTILLLAAILAAILIPFTLARAIARRSGT